MLSEKLLKEMNDQIKFEMFSANLYLAMSAYAADQQLDGFAHWFKVQADEENFHAMKFFGYINEMGGRVKMQALDEPKNDFTSVEELFSYGLEHEKFVTSRIHLLMNIAMDERDHNSIGFLKWFVDEQREEENSFDGNLRNLKRFGKDVMFHMDKELGTRVFVPPAAE
ncbi:MAG TPA: ferritin [Bacillota bacterium]|nr:ferritin [Bacillota bacterium]